MGKGVGKIDTRVAKTAASTSFEDDSVKQAGENTRRRLSANSRDKSNSFWTSLLATQENNTGGKSTLG